MKTMTTKMCGDKGEDFACAIIKENGYSIVKRNFYCKYGEIDIIAQNHQYLLFIEVKTRACDYILRPLLAVSKQKQNKIIQTALIFLSENPTKLQPRFDIFEIITDSNKSENQAEFRVKTYNYIRNAFNVGGNYKYF